MKQSFFKNRNKTELIIEFAALLGLIANLALYIFSINNLPDRIPTHFSFSGEADGWGSKNYLILPSVVSVFLYSILTIVWFFPSHYNYPVKLNAANKEIQAGLAKKLLLILKAEVVWLFLFLQFKTIQVAEKNTSGLGPLFILVFLIIIFVTIGTFILKMYKVK
jgi:uncharacterized membrane protein